MCRIKDLLPIDSLMAILEDHDSSDAFPRMDVARFLASIQAEEALDLFLHVLMDPDEHPWLREAMTSYLTMWGEPVSGDLLLTLLIDPEPAVVTAALEELRDWPPDALPFETLLSYCTHEKDYVRSGSAAEAAHGYNVGTPSPCSKKTCPPFQANDLYQCHFRESFALRQPECCV